ncbi:MAG: MbnP family copper-binding protein [Pseudomonadota bacterium]|jgi:uncharacterized repeat protein (TIGR04052 family)
MRYAFLILSTFAPLMIACSSDDSSESSQTVEIQFRPYIGDSLLKCSQTYTGLGTTGSTIEVRDFRFYLNDPKLLTEDGTSVDLQLTPDGKWQRGETALLDFTDGQGLCDAEGATQNTKIVGTVPPGRYVGLSFQFGLPPELNHLDAATETAPFNETGMWWTWKGGYKFARFDFKTTGQETFFFHLGATNCNGSLETGFTCAFNHQVQITLSDFNLQEQVIGLDVKQLLAANDLDAPVAFQAGDVVKGCMSFAGDPECGALFEKIGLKFSSEEQGPAQSLFQVISKTTFP